MFTTAGLFKDLACPERDTCTRPQCIYSHLSNIPPPKPLGKPAFTSPQSASGTSSGLPRDTAKESVIPAKRPAIVSPSKLLPVSAEPPRKVQKVNPGKRISVPTASHTEVRNVIHLRRHQLSYYSLAYLFFESMQPSLRFQFPFARYEVPPVIQFKHV